MPRLTLGNAARLGLLISLLLQGTAQGAVLRWNQPGGGSFIDAANWSPATAPRQGDVVVFDLDAPGTYTVATLKGQVDRLVVGTDALVLDGNGGANLELLNTSTSEPSLLVAGVGGQFSMLTISNGARIFAQHALFGAAPSALAEVTLSDAALELAGGLTVADSGVAKLLLENRGRVTLGGALEIARSTSSAADVDLLGRNTSLTVGTDAQVGGAGIGSLRVTQEARATVLGQLTLGHAGAGSLDLSARGALQSGAATLGALSGSQGEASLVGQHSRWHVDGKLVVGDAGTGSLSVTDGASLTTTGNLALGASITGKGTVDVHGRDSSLEVARELQVGVRGAGELRLFDGAQLEVGESGVLGVLAGSSGRVEMSGTGTHWRNRLDVIVGLEGTGTLLASRGAMLESLLSAYVGHQSGSYGEARFTGGQTGWSIASDLFVGYLGSGSLEVLDGAIVRNTLSAIGVAPTTTGSVTVARDGFWENRGDLFIGWSGRGELDVLDDGLVVASNVVIAANAADAYGRMTIRDKNSVVGIAGNLYVGGIGTVNSVGGPGIAGGEALVQIGSGSTLRVAGTTRILERGRLELHGGLLRTSGFENRGIFDFTTGTFDYTGGLLRVAPGAGLPGYFESRLAIGPGQTVIASREALEIDDGGAVAIDSADAELLTPVLRLGGTGHGSLLVGSGGNLDNGGEALIGNIAGSSGELTVRGNGSRWENVREIIVGNFGAGLLSVLDGATVDSGHFYIGRHAGSSATVDIAGSGSRVDARGELYVGVDDQASLAVRDGARFNVGLDASIGTNGVGDVTLRRGGMLGVAGDLLLGTGVSGNGALDVDGGDSRVNVGLDLSVGVLGVGKLDLRGGAALTVGRSGEIAVEQGSMGRVLLSGFGTTWRNAFDLAVGLRGFGELEMRDGALLQTGTNALIGHQRGALGRAQLTGSRTEWNVTNAMFVGYEGAGDLALSDGALLIDGGSAIGFASGANGSAVVSGSDTLWWSKLEQHVGFSGTGSLRVLDGGYVTTQTGEVGFNAGSRGSVVLSDGGRWEVTGTLSVGGAGQGSVEISDGGMLRSTRAFIARGGASSRARVTVRGASSSWYTAEDLTIGLGGSQGEGIATVTVSDGGELEVGNFLLLNGRSSLLLDGGSIRTGTATFFGSFEFRSGTITFTTGAALVGDVGITGLFENELNLDGNRHLVFTDNVLGVQSAGRVKLTRGASLTARGGFNAGRIEIDGGLLHLTTPGDGTRANLLNVGLIEARNATLRFDGGLANLTTLKLADSRIEGNVENNGLVELVGHNTFTGRINGHGAFGGEGDALLLGSSSPGLSPGRLEFAGDVIFGDTHLLEIELGGLTPGSEYDQIVSGGRLTLGGTLDVELLDDYAPLLGDSFDIAIAAFIDGEFADLLLPTLADGLRWRTLQLSDPLGRALYRLEVSAVPLPPAVWLLGSACVLIVARARRR